MRIQQSGLGSILLGTVVLSAIQPRADAQLKPEPNMVRTAGANVAVNAESHRRAMARVELAMRILDRFEPQARTRGVGRGWRQASLESLLTLSLDELRQVERDATDVETLASVTASLAEDPGSLGDAGADLVYKPITPCRFIDTRVVAGKISGIRAFDVDVSGSSYGGEAFCIPSVLFAQTGAGIGAVAMNVTIVDTSAAAAPGFVALKPTAASPTTSLLNWYEQGMAVQVANQGIVSLTGTAGNDFVIQTSGPVHIVADMFGAFIPPAATPLSTVHVFDSMSIPPHTAYALNESPPCPPTYRLTGGGCFSEAAGSGGLLLVSYPGAGDDRWGCVASSHDAAITFWARAICARIPGR